MLKVIFQLRTYESVHCTCMWRVFIEKKYIYSKSLNNITFGFEKTFFTTQLFLKTKSHVVQGLAVYVFFFSIKTLHAYMLKYILMEYDVQADICTGYWITKPDIVSLSYI